ncbi:hypothetical protein DUI70_6110 [Streptomyces albus]|nr:hypothetical protein DUI70_6110 [Streptomyces albus]
MRKPPGSAGTSNLADRGEVVGMARRTKSADAARGFAAGALEGVSA